MLDELVPGSCRTERAAGARRGGAKGNPFFLEDAASPPSSRRGRSRSCHDSVHALLAAARRPARHQREVGPAGGVRDRPCLLGRAGAGARDGRAGRLAACSRTGTSSAAGRARRSTARRSTRSSTPSRARSSTGASPKARRASLHADFAGWLERTGGGRDEDAALLAHHYAQAAGPEDADLAWADAPDELERLRAAAVRWLRRAASSRSGATTSTRASPTSGARSSSARRIERSGLWREIGRASALKFDGERFWEAMKQALKLDRRPGRAGGHPRKPGRPDRYSLRDVASSARALGSGALDRPGARPREGGQRRRHVQALLARAYWNPSEEHAAAEEADALAAATPETRPALVRVGRPWPRRRSREREYDASFAWAQRRVELMPRIADLDHHTE